MSNHASTHTVLGGFLRALPSATVMALLTLGLTLAQAQSPGAPDATFNGSGVLISDAFVGNVGQQMAAVLVQPDGKTVAVGSCNTTGGSFPSVDNGTGFCAVRYNLDGSVDTGFGTGGRWKQRDRVSIASLTSFDSIASSAALQSNGTIVIAGSCRNLEVCIARVTPAGTSGVPFNRVAPTFLVGGNGEVKVAIQADQKIVLLTTKNDQTTAARLTDVGVLDLSYGTSGIATATSPTPSPSTMIIRDAYVDPTSGKLVGLAKRTPGVAGVNAEIFRFNTNGTIDSTFDADGFVSVTLSTDEQKSDTFALAPSAGGGVQAVVRATSQTQAGYFLGSIRLLANGAGDTSFGPNGLRISSTEADAGCGYGAAQVLPDGKIVFVGHTLVSVGGNRELGYDVCRIRLNSDLSVDNGFATSPSLFSSGVAYGEYFVDMAIAVGKDAKIVTADTCRPGGSTASAKFCLQRFDYLAQNCYDVDGDGSNNPLVDGLILLRAQLGFRNNAVTDGIGIPVTAPRKTWPVLRDFMLYSCGMRGL